MKQVYLAFLVSWVKNPRSPLIVDLVVFGFSFIVAVCPATFYARTQTRILTQGAASAWLRVTEPGEFKTSGIEIAGVWLGTGLTLATFGLAFVETIAFTWFTDYADHLRRLDGHISRQPSSSPDVVEFRTHRATLAGQSVISDVRSSARATLCILTATSCGVCALFLESRLGLGLFAAGLFATGLVCFMFLSPRPPTFRRLVF